MASLRSSFRLLKRWVILCSVAALPGCGKSSTAPKVEPGTGGSALTAFAAVPGDAQVMLHWENPATTDFRATVIRRKRDAAPSSLTDGDEVYDGADKSLVDSNVTNGVTYYYAAWVRYYPNDLSAAVTARARPLPPEPNPPTGLLVGTGIHALNLSWTNPTSANFQKVRVKRRTDHYPLGPTDGTTAYEGTGSSFTDSNLLAGQQYYYSVFAIDVYGQNSTGLQGAGTPGYETLTITIPAWSASHLFPEQRVGDGEFAGHGPRVRVHVYYTVTLPYVNAYVYFDAQEWENGAVAGDGSRAYSTFPIGVKATIPAGFSFYAWLNDSDEEFVYVDTDHDHDIFTFGTTDPYSRLEILGDTDGYDIGNQTDDDTQLWQINANSRSFVVRR